MKNTQDESDDKEFQSDVKKFQSDDRRFQYPLPENDEDGSLEDIQSDGNGVLRNGEFQEASVPYEVASQVEAALRRYLEIQKQMKQLEDERQSLRDIIVRHMRQRQSNIWQTKIDGANVNIKCFQQTVVTYNEDLLRERLGSRYVEILEPDLKKLKEHLPEVRPLLESLLPLVGTPSRERIRDVCEQGRMEPAMFKGAFEKTETQRFAVSQFGKQF